MIKNFKLLRNIGQFDYVDAGKNIDLGKLSLIFADNGRGKTTLATILRSLSEGTPDMVLGRQRLGSKDSPNIVIQLDNGSPPFVFEKGNWNTSLNGMRVFDDSFVEDNVCSGLNVSPQQRQNLHDIILGPKAVVLSNSHQECVYKIEKHNQQLKIKEAAIPKTFRGSLSVDDFCNLSADPDIDERLKETERKITAGQQQTSIIATKCIPKLTLPEFNLEKIDDVLQADLDSLEVTTLERIQTHFSGLGQGGEKWVSEGMNLLRHSTSNDSATGACPFCGQPLDASALIAHYRAYFSDSYNNLKNTIHSEIAKISQEHGEQVRTQFEGRVRGIEQLWQFWRSLCEIDSFSLDTSETFRDWRAAWNAITEVLVAKQKSPLENIEIPKHSRELVAAYCKHAEPLNDINDQINKANNEIQKLKEDTPTYDEQALTNELQLLRVIKSRGEPNTSQACTAYLQEQKDKACTEKMRDDLRKELDSHRSVAFEEYGSAVNRYLGQFGTGFKIEKMKPQNRRSGSASTYSAKINNQAVNVVKANPTPVEPSFGNVFSGGDRTTLAFAFFLASLDQEPDLSNTIVVIDDPISSMDINRSLTTAQIIRRVAERAAQVIVLSHSKQFLCTIWEGAAISDKTAIEIVRQEESSTLREWDVSEDSLNEHDRRHQKLEDYHQKGVGDKREVALCIRLHLEGYLRSACPRYLKPRMPLGGWFVKECHNSLKSASPILPKTKLSELEELLEYAHKFHHETKPAWKSEDINDQELNAFVKRTLDFLRL